MPKIGKSLLSSYVYTRCDRQAFFKAFSSPGERMDLDVPMKQQRAENESSDLAASGMAWEAQKQQEIFDLFGEALTCGAWKQSDSDAIVFSSIDLSSPDMLSYAATTGGASPLFLIQSEFDVALSTAFIDALGLAAPVRDQSAQISKAIPDVIVVLPDTDSDAGILDADGAIHVRDPNDTRKRLRVVDIKLASDPIPSYFAEVVYYSMALAGWLQATGFDRDFVVVADAGVWAGSHEASSLSILHKNHLQGKESVDQDALYAAFKSEIMTAPTEMFAPMITRIFSDRIVPVLKQKEWREIPCVITKACAACEFSGINDIKHGSVSPDLRYCFPCALADRDVSMIFGATQSMITAMRAHGLKTIDDVVAAGIDSAIAVLPIMKDRWPVLWRRAKVLAKGAPDLSLSPDDIPLMPINADIKIYVAADWDRSSEVSLALAFMPAFEVDGHIHYGRPQTFIVDVLDAEIEAREFGRFMDAVHSVLFEARQKNKHATYHVYFWDQMTRDHLRTVAFRHFSVTSRISGAEWLFSGRRHFASDTITVPVSIIGDIIRNAAAASLPFDYDLDGIASLCAAHDPSRLPYDQNQQIMGDSAHDIWTRAQNWTQALLDVRQRTESNLKALTTVSCFVDSVGAHKYLRPQTIPDENVDDRRSTLNRDSKIWMALAALNNDAARTKIEAIRAMSAAAREQSGKSAVLTRRLFSFEFDAALQAMDIENRNGRRGYEISLSSRWVSLKPGDTGWTLDIADEPGFLRSSYADAVRGQERHDQDRRFRTMEDACAVRIVAIDRRHGIIILDPASADSFVLDRIEAAGSYDLSKNLFLTPVHVDVFQDRIETILYAIGNPEKALSAPLTPGRKQLLAADAKSTAASTFLWSPREMEAATSTNNVAASLAWLRSENVFLNPSQELAVENCLSRQLHLIWGPPGTGKSHTLKATALALIWNAIKHKRKLRVLVTGFTWASIDNIFYDLHDDGDRIFGEQITFSRVRSPASRHPVKAGYEHTDVLSSRFKPSESGKILRAALSSRNPFASGAANIHIVAATPHQVFNLSWIENGNLDDLFDLIIVDEASQMDVAQSILCLSALSSNGAVIVAGDPLQLGPVHEYEASGDIEAVTGSLYGFLANIHGVNQTQLTVNYRSSQAIVDYCRQAGYGRSLSSFSPQLSIEAVADAGSRPASFPQDLEWSSLLATIIDPGKPMVGIIQEQNESVRADEFEAQMTAALVFMAWSTYSAALIHENGYDGVAMTTHCRRYTPEEFWERGVGIVTPHRAQQAMIISALEHAFAHEPGPHAQLLAAAVDTVERFQGQQRDLVIASYAVGDAEQIMSEAGFIFSQNRINVLASRARAKLIILGSRNLVDVIPQSMDIVRESAMLKSFFGSVCDHGVKEKIRWRHPDHGVVSTDIEIRWKPEADARSQHKAVGDRTDARRGGQQKSGLDGAMASLSQMFSLGKECQL